MTVNQYFRNYNNQSEQRLIEDLIIEAIRMYGIDVWYLPRTINRLDQLYTTDTQSSYDAAYLIEAYPAYLDGFGPEGNLMTNFGVQIRQQIIFELAIKRFFQEVGSKTGQPRPNEGDIIFFPPNKRVLQIKFVDNKEFQFQFGTLQTYKLTTELFEYSNEHFDTGIPEIDSMDIYSTNILDFAYKLPNGNYLLDAKGGYILASSADPEIVNPILDTETIDDEANNVIDWSVTNPFGDPA